jgi:lysophospholipase L1-like esterase
MAMMRAVSRSALVLGLATGIGLVAGLVFLASELRHREAALRLARSLELAPAALRPPAAPDWPEGATRVLIAGDSRVAQWAPRPEIPGQAVRFAGIGGETTAELRRRLERDLAFLAPDRLVVAAGINDLVAASLNPAEAEAVVAELLVHLAAIADLGRSEGIAVTLATILQPSRPDPVRRLFFWSDAIRGLVERTNAGIRELAGREKLRLMDLDAALGTGPAAPLPGGFATDTLHLNAEAYRRLNLLLAEAPGE